MGEMGCGDWAGWRNWEWEIRDEGEEGGNWDEENGMWGFGMEQRIRDWGSRMGTGGDWMEKMGMGPLGWMNQGWRGLGGNLGGGKWGVGKLGMGNQGLGGRMGWGKWDWGGTGDGE